jgi:polysaccharide chain length determinant protein (PEP-CTERM system associated)
MNALLVQVFDEVHGAWRFRWLALAVATLLASLGWLVVFALPDRYEANATVFVDTRTALKPVLQGLTVEQDVDAQLNYVRQSLLAGPALQVIARESGVLPPSVTDLQEQEQLLTDFAKRVDISVRSASDREDERKTAGSIYGIDYLDSNRERSLRVVNVLLNALVNETLGGKREGAESAQKFLRAEIRDYEERLRTAEDRIAAFKSRNFGLMPTEQGGYFAQLQKETEAVSDVKTKLAEAQSRRAALVKQLHGDAAVSAAAAPSSGSANGGGAGGDTLSQIAQAQAHLDELLLKFTDKYPDVVAAKQTLDELKQRRAAEIESLRRGDANAAAASGASTNPVFQSIQLALNQADVEIADLNTELLQHQEKVAELHRHLDTAPQVEAEYAQLNRDYDVNKAEYTALLANYEKARLGERADNAGSVRFEIVQPPTASFRPVWPRRVLALAGVLFGALGAGGALAYGLHQLRPVVASPSSLAQLTGVRVLGVVGLAYPTRARRASRFDVWFISLAGGGLLAALVAVVTLSELGYRFSLVALKNMVNV